MGRDSNPKIFSKSHPREFHSWEPPAQEISSIFGTAVTWEKQCNDHTDIMITKLNKPIINTLIISSKLILHAKKIEKINKLNI